MNQDQPIAVSARTAARMLDLKASTVTYLVETGRIPATKVGRTWRIRVRDLQALVEPTTRHHDGDGTVG